MILSDLFRLGVGTAICLVMEAVFSGAELALVTCDKLRLSHRAARGEKGARIALQLVRRPEWFFSTTLLGQNLFIVGNSVLVTFFIFKYLGTEYEALGLLLAPVILIFGEALPKSIFQRGADRLGPRVAPFILFFSYLCFPVVWALSRFTLLLMGGVRGAVPSGPRVSRETLELFVKEAQRSEALSENFRRMLLRILSFSQQRTREVMTPLVEVVSLRESSTIRETLQMLGEERHTYLPIYQRRSSNIVGVVSVFDLLFNPRLDAPVGEVMTPPLYVSELMGVKELFLLLRKEQRPFAVVVDEYGGAQGVVTMEDILEEIVGEIEDEYDIREANWTRLETGRYLFRGRTAVDEINETFHWEIPKGNYETLAGFLVDRLGHIPREGEELKFGDLTFRVKAATPRSVGEVWVEQRESSLQ